MKAVRFNVFIVKFFKSKLNVPTATEVPLQLPARVGRMTPLVENSTNSFHLGDIYLYIYIYPKRQFFTDGDREGLGREIILFLQKGWEIFRHPAEND